MKIKLPVVLRSTYERETSELVSDINVLEGVKDASDKKIESLKSELLELKDSSYFTVREKDREIEKLKLELEKREKQIKGMEWCIQERDKELDKVKAFNMDLYKKVELAGEMYRQFKDKVDKACEIEFVTRTITHEDIKKFMKVEDIIQLYTLIGIAGK
ncbi:hypothetical protein [Paraclostridium bifermentans]|uniref:hypothetical protein n=1 Tax=Paraclostridium bifermentans TaxID=1490 RepID=UPI001C81C6F3|nr:hypothetical protein [Paraclostridium bifermentans]GIM32738.1 hypothetical protein PAGU1678_20080 [Paraclostridium bifermentans subsp. muricolitidis]